MTGLSDTELLTGGRNAAARETFMVRNPGKKLADYSISIIDI